MRIAEFYAGIGGLSATLAKSTISGADVVLALEQSEDALRAYSHAFPDVPAPRTNLEHLAAKTLTEARLDFWWLSPPCQPYTVKGAKKDLDDPRTLSFRHLLLKLLPEAPPRHLALENVVGFRQSRGHALWTRTLRDLGYTLWETELCPSELGIPMRRPRYYCFASRDDLPARIDSSSPAPAFPPTVRRKLREFVDPDADSRAELALDAAVIRKFGAGLRVLDRDDPEAYTTCFTSSYGRALMRSGSYLLAPKGTVRRFSPEEILRLLDFPPGFTFPGTLPLQSQWKLAGNSLSITAVESLIRRVWPNGPPGILPKTSEVPIEFY